MAPFVLGQWQASATASDRCSDDTTSVVVQVTCPMAPALRLESRKLTASWNATSGTFDAVFINATGTVGFRGNMSGLSLERHVLGFEGPMESESVAALVRLPSDPNLHVLPDNLSTYVDPSL